MDAREVPGGGWEWGRSTARADLEAPTLAFQQGQKGCSKTKLKNKLLGKNRTKQNKMKTSQQTKKPFLNHGGSSVNKVLATHT